MELFIKLLAFVFIALPVVSNAEKIDLYNLKGKAVVYIDTDEEAAIYTWNGKAVSYLVYGCGPKCFYIYSWKGRHLGFFENGIIYDLEGTIVGSVRGALKITYYAPYAKYAQYAQYAKYARHAPYAKPAYTNSASLWDLKAFMTQDQKK